MTERAVRRVIAGARTIETVVFWGCVALWLVGSVVSGVFFGLAGFLAAFWSPLVVFLVVHPFRVAAVRRRSGQPAVEWQAVGCWFVCLALLGLGGLVLFLGVEMLGWMLGV
ncbi:hypothetical protein ACQP1W_52325 [Spirillospora sp. CA-255316]